MRTCPLGHTCPECLWEVQTVKMNAATGDERIETTCAIPEMVQAQVATYQQTFSVGKAIEISREASIARQDSLLKIVGKPS